MKLSNVHDLLALTERRTISKRNLFDLIQFSKIETSPYWSGGEYIIGNTPQQGINWIGNPKQARAVIIKARLGSYEEDGWNNHSREEYRYSFKARKKIINHAEIANDVLIKQPLYNYPILLLTEHSDGWILEGRFAVSEILERYVTLGRITPYLDVAADESVSYVEGTRRYVTHLMTERNQKLINLVKSNNAWICEICEEDFFVKYGVEYIEAHHTIPLSTFTSEYAVKPSDLVLLCPNCHKAVHIHMKKSGLDYASIKTKLTHKV